MKWAPTTLSVSRRRLERIPRSIRREPHGNPPSLRRTLLLVLRRVGRFPRRDQFVFKRFLLFRHPLVVATVHINVDRRAELS